MDLSTRYLGFDLPHPLMPGAAAPLASTLDAVRRLEDAGAPAIVLHSLFEEQVRQEQAASIAIDDSTDSFGEALNFFPHPPGFLLGPDEYLEHVGRTRAAVEVPVIASLNGVTRTGWIEYARLIEQAGAHALELNIYFVAADPDEPSWEVENRVINLAREVKRAVAIPVAVKLTPFFTSFAFLARRLEDVKVDGLVLFNRFYQPDIDIEELDVTPLLEWSTSAELVLRLQWLAILSGRVQLSLAASGGIHVVDDVVKAIMAGAHAVQVVSALFTQGLGCLAGLRQRLAEWLEFHEYDSLRQMQGSMDLRHCPNPTSFSRASYMSVIHGLTAARSEGARESDQWRP